MAQSHLKWFGHLRTLIETLVIRVDKMEDSSIIKKVKEDQ